MKLYTKIADLSDWKILSSFYLNIYRERHPLQNFDFFNWQYSDPHHGRSFILTDGKKIYGHVGAYFEDGYAWIINVYLDPDHRGKGWVGQLYEMARKFGYPLVATSANEAGLGLYRKMGWIRYSNLERFVLYNPAHNQLPAEKLIQPVQLSTKIHPPESSLHYWRQPGILGSQLADGSTGIAQYPEGGFRFTEIRDILQAEKEVWTLGFLWCDYITSWNDPLIDTLLSNGWISQSRSKFPWFLKPVDTEKPFMVSFLSEDPIDKKFIVRRYHSDHGRVGSL